MNRNDWRLLGYLLVLSAAEYTVWIAGVAHGYREGIAGLVRTWGVL